VIEFKLNYTLIMQIDDDIEVVSETPGKKHPINRELSYLNPEEIN
jgi:hypothetical protein